MRIKDIEAFPISIPLRRVIPSSPWRAMTRVIVRVSTDEGITGTGESFGALSPLTVCHEIEDGFKPVLLGEDPTNIERLLDRMRRASTYAGRRGITRHAMSGIEIALWDILGKEHGIPVYRMLGGRYHDRVKAYASLPRINDLEELTAEVASRAREGFRAIKLHQTDPESVRASREAVGEGVELMVDINCVWNPHEAIAMARIFEGFGIRWLEEPVWPPDDYDGLAAVSEAVDVPIAAGENEDTREGFKRLISGRAVDILQPSPTKMGGVLEFKKVCAMAEAWNVPVAPHSWTLPLGVVAALHVATTTPNCLYLEVPPELEEELLAMPLRVREGHVQVPDGPGLGVELNEEIVTKFLQKG